MRGTDGRHELKHYINYADLLQLRARLPCVMKLDENTDTDGGYRIRSLYFDNYSDKALREKIDGVDEREKFRLRFYKDDPSFIRLEKKSKKMECVLSKVLSSHSMLVKPCLRETMKFSRKVVFRYILSYMPKCNTSSFAPKT